MTLFIIGLIFMGLAMIAVGLMRTYYKIPIKELKRRARSGDQLASFLYRPVSYGASLKLVLLVLIITLSAIAFVCFSKSSASWFAFLLITFFLWLGFVWIPSSQLTGIGARLAIWFTPFVTWLVRILYPVLDRIANYIKSHRPISIHTGLYQKDDLVEVLQGQKKQADNRIPSSEIDLVIHALKFGDKIVGDVMTPRRKVRFVKENESLGPLLMDELHKSGFSRFPVVSVDGEDDKENIIGTLLIKDMINKKAGGDVKSAMRNDVFYVREDFVLMKALQAFLKTKHHLFIVVNSFEEVVGVITIEDILEQVIGKQIVDEFDRYESLREVAHLEAKEDKKERRDAGRDAETMAKDDAPKE